LKIGGRWFKTQFGIHLAKMAVCPKKLLTGRGIVKATGAKTYRYRLGNW
jgi:hypothetical protein